MLFSTHAMLAALTRVEELEIEKAEADKLATAVRDVSRHYNVKGVSAKTLDWINLINACGAVYGQRYLAYRVRKMAERQERAARQAPVIVARPPAPGAGGDTPLKPSTVPPEGARYEEVVTPDGPVRVRLQ